jgi:hypothetical protein
MVIRRRDTKSVKNNISAFEILIFCVLKAAGTKKECFKVDRMRATGLNPHSQRSPGISVGGPHENGGYKDEIKSVSTQCHRDIQRYGVAEIRVFLVPKQITFCVKLRRCIVRGVGEKSARQKNFILYTSEGAFKIPTVKCDHSSS